MAFGTAIHPPMDRSGRLNKVSLMTILLNPVKNSSYPKMDFVIKLLV
jgi:hypothetical protein